MTEFRLPHPIALLFGGIILAAMLTWAIPAGEYDRQVDTATGRTVAVAGTYHSVEAHPVGLFGTGVAVPRGFVEGADVVATILIVGAAFFLLDLVGTLGRLLTWLVRILKGRGLMVVPILVIFFGIMGAAENMQEEIIALVPVLLLLGRRTGIDAVAMVATSAGAAIVGSAFGPTNPFQAGIALTLAEVPVLEGGGLRLAMWTAGLLIWTFWVLRYIKRNRLAPEVTEASDTDPITWRDGANMAFVMLPLTAYVYGALNWDWGFNELSGAFLLGAIGIGIVAKLGTTGTVNGLLQGAQAMLPAALLVGLARSISLVLTDGKIIDTILHAMATPLGQVPPAVSGLLMVPMHALLHIPISSVSGQAALTMPIMIPLADLVGLSRQAAVLAYQTGGGLMEMFTPTNGALLAVLLAAKVPYQKWLKFSVGGVAIVALVGIAGILVAL